MMPLNNSSLRGSIPPLVTPFRDGKVDFNKFAELAERQVQRGSNGIVVAGTTGEPSSLSVEERIDAERQLEAARLGRVPTSEPEPGPQTDGGTDHE